MVQFTKLRVAGFKSFVEPTELVIERGVTGIVGPNGCGKSNLVEALKWAMGETSPKQVRGGEMSDVIFGGSGNRPPRNIAEVIISLDNADRTSPAQFNDHDDIEVSRRIEREKGSAYRVNSKEVRARDVQLLFADAATGARSTALVSQGHIGEIIAAKPSERRSLLEEAAGITGLHSRRHEAELRLRGAETNLERMDDILITLDAQMQGLKKQARQATRYRNLNDHIRRAEATLFLLRWIAVSEENEGAQAKLAEAEALVAELTSVAAQAATEQANAASGLPELRQAEVEAAAALHRLTVARDNLDEEERRIEAALAECDARLEQVASDTGRETARAEDAEAAAQRLEEERARITAALEGEEDARAEAEERLTEARSTSETAEAALSEINGKIADTEARREELTRRHRDLTGQIERLRAAKAEIAERLGEVAANAAAAQALKAWDNRVASAKETADRADEAAEAAGKRRAERADALTDARETAQAADSKAARLNAESSALAKLLKSGDPELWPPLIDAVTVEPGYELALGAALGDDLTAATNEAAPVHWRILGKTGREPALPGGVSPLSDYVRGHEALERRLSQIGVVEDDQAGKQLAGQLEQGQRLVSRSGALWRWDGYTAVAEAPTSAAARLEQRNRLNDLQGELKSANAARETARAAAERAREAFDQADALDKSSREEARRAGNVLNESREARTRLAEKVAEIESRAAALSEASGRVDTDLEAAELALSEASEAQAALPNADAERERATAFRTEVAEKRTTLMECQRAYDDLRRELDSHGARLEAIAGEFDSWTERGKSAREQLEQLGERHNQVTAARAQLVQRPQEIAAQRDTLMTSIEDAEAKRNEAADKLAEAETKASEADRALKNAESRLAVGREDRVRAEAAIEQAKQSLHGLGERIADRLDIEPDGLRELSGLKEDAELPELEATERRVDRLLRERENMGPVNLRAEQESQELAEQIETMETERGDLVTAIDKLRHGINELNREGRQRLLTSFEEVDKHFQELFVRLFGGGRAHLKLTDSDDPLEAGLEIMASPPGKRLQILSLLSGGEQALTALALMFAVFLTNPAPICVLDEVDAPLDDANVDRFCSLVEEIAHSLSTRFLVITHHRMTMSRMDRLFGVTMAEQGVSQLVSVDLGEAEQLRATA